MTTTSPLAAVEPKLRPTSPKHQPLTVRRHDMWGPSRVHAPHHDEHEVSLYQPIAPVEVDTPAWLHTVGRIAGWPFRAIAAAWRRQGDLRDLRGIDDHLLRDMGLTRGELRDAIRKGEHPRPDRG
jgi:uncharacterized protein YjiS (DUF1127 family)